MNQDTFKQLKDLLFDGMEARQDKLQRELIRVQRELEGLRMVSKESPLIQSRLERYNERLDVAQIQQSALIDELRSMRDEVKAERIYARVEPELDRKLNSRVEELRQMIKDSSPDDIAEAIRAEILDSRDDMIDALYPIMGNLVKKYIQVELEQLMDNINQQIDDTFSFDSLKREFYSLFGIKERDMLLKQIARPVIEEVYVIYQESGLLIGHYSARETLDQDMVAGMLTAIKSFVEDAFQQSGGNLDMIEYGEFKILIQNYRKYYIVAVVSGIVDTSFKMQLLNRLNSFGEKRLSRLREKDLQHEDADAEVSEMLAKHFEEAHETPKQEDNSNRKFWSW